MLCLLTLPTLLVAEFWLQLISGVTLLLLLMLIFLKYTFTIKNNTITYTTTLFGQILYTKEVQAADIVRVTFKRFNWATRLAVIKTSKGLPIRVALFKPETVFEDLTIFCKDYNVPYTKTKDYQILEKLG
ncbi:diguanylate cyclase [Lysinibacillus louembei]|uniref:Diguanylate cyclase n=1 Tax=Lysinibacillus louembei TaxID=1470088 RepID=A0ABZ0RZI2_9BACI|nr:diguanylate cyclase [Lysinibacillus louembei]WPK12646.1 diguanylate cyclase [Lysinibacillus louembei]